MKTQQTLGVLAIVFGIFFLICEVFGTYEFLRADQNGLTYVVFAGCGIATAVSLLPAWAAYASHGRPDLSFALWALFLIAFVMVNASAIARTGKSTDLAQDQRVESTDKLAEFKKQRDDARQDLADAKAELKRAREAAAAAAKEKNCAANCANVLTKSIESADKAVNDAQKSYDEAKARVVEAPPPKTDGFANRIASALSWAGVTPEHVRTYQPVVVPFLMSALSATLLALGVWSLQRHAPPPAPQQLEALEPDAEDEPELEAVTDADTAEPLALQFSGPGAVLLGFASKRIRRASDSELSMRDVLADYEAFCVTTGDPPIERHDFVRELAALCQRTGIDVRVEGKDAFLIGAKLAA